MKITLLASLVTIGLGTTFATTTDSLQITVGGLTATIADNGTCTGTGCGSLFGDINPIAGSDTVTGSIGGWDLNIVSGTSHSPGLTPFGLDVSSLTATCNGGGCTTTALDIQYSDINFSPAPPSFSTFYSATITGGGTTSESAYYSNGNTLFAESTLIGTVGPFSSPGGSGTASGGTGAVAPYSLTLDQVFTDAKGGPVSFSVDGNITGVPEPGAVIMFGTVLVFCASKLRRQRAS
jgi:hypothetical protein